MSKKGKIAIALLGIAAFALIILLIIANKNKKEVVEISIPQGSLSSDFFVSQNTIYEESEELSSTVLLSFAPYSVDVPDTLSGIVGEGVVYNIDDLYTLYISESDEEVDVMEHLLGEYPQSVLLKADSSKCKYEAIAKGNGYINGFAADYLVGKINISDGASNAESYMVAYILKIPDYNENLTIGVTSKVLSTDSLTFAEQYAVKVIKTLQFKEEYLEGMILRRPPVVEEELTEDVFKELLSEMAEEKASEEVIPEVPNNAIVQIEEINIPKDYQELTIIYSWENEETMIEAKLYSGGTKFSPTRYERGKAVFEIGTLNAGSYQMEIRGYDYGETSVELLGE